MLLVFQISNHLKSAHKWFKDKFDNLQDELQASRLVEQMKTKYGKYINIDLLL